MIASRSLIAASFAVAAMSAGAPAWAGDHGWRTAADVGVAGLVAGALGTTAAKDDWTGAGQFALDEGTTIAVTYGLKHAFPEMRPNGRNDQSFPSGHTAVSFAAAGYLQDRYGWRVGAPAAAVAAFVGVARIKSRDHHWYDVLAGAALGEGAALAFTRPYDSSVRVVPWATSHGAGLSLAARF